MTRFYPSRELGMTRVVVVRERRDSDRRLGLRLAVAAAAVFVIGVPFALLVLLVRAKWAPLFHLDQNAAGTLHRLALRHAPLVTTLKMISTVFDPLVFRLVATGVAAWLFVARRPRLAAWTLVTAWGSGLLDTVAKHLVGRARPVFDVPVARAPGQSFPSGHALGTVVGCGVLLLVLLPLVRSAIARRLCWAAAAAIVLAVGYARIGLGVHYVSDVLAGWVLGLGWLAATTAAFEAWRREIGAPTPPPAEEGLEPEMGQPHAR
jgi:membrane-associated phospholipid phosphatase